MRLKDLPHNEKNFSDCLTNALIRFKSTNSSETKGQLDGAKDRLAFVSKSLQSGKPVLSNFAKQNADAKFASEVQDFLRSDVDKKEFGPFADKHESEKGRRSTLVQLEHIL